jgi:hypothetical protein
MKAFTQEQLFDFLFDNDLDEQTGKDIALELRENPEGEVALRIKKMMEPITKRISAFNALRDEITEGDMIDFMGGKSTPYKETLIRKQFENPNSFASKFVAEWGERARTALNVDWLKIAGLKIDEEKK